MLEKEESLYIPIKTESIVDGLRYNVDQSEFIADLSLGWFTIYKTQNGRYFITRNQSEQKILDYFFRFDYLMGIKKDITPLSVDEVIKFLEKEKRLDIITREFPDIPNA